MIDAKLVKDKKKPEADTRNSKCTIVMRSISISVIVTLILVYSKLLSKPYFNPNIMLKVPPEKANYSK